MHSHDGMHQGIEEPKAYCFAGEVFISENLRKMQALIPIISSDSKRGKI
jgi:hypothetical protein